MQKTRFAIAATLMLAACDAGNKDQDRIDNADIADNVVTEVSSTDMQRADNAATNAAVPPAPGPAGNAVPDAFRGRWGMVPLDCGPDAAIAKGLMTVSGRELRFYESVGKPAVVNYPTPTRMEGRFSFTGEGMEWSKDMTLTVEGDTLVRTERDPVARYTYTRCP